MINFNCPGCNQKIRTDDSSAGKHVRCPKCGQPIHVPAPVSSPADNQTTIIKIRCPGCNQKIGLDKSFAGKTVRCAKCKTAFKVPGGAPPKTAIPPVPKPPVKEIPVPAPSEEAGSGNMFDDNLLNEQLLASENQAAKIDESLKLSGEPQKEQQNFQKRCPRCGEMIAVESQVCPICAFELGGATKGKAMTGTSNMKRSLIVAGICIAIMLAVSIVAIATIVPQFKKMQPKTGSRQDEAKLVAEKYVNCMKNSDYGGARDLFDARFKDGLTNERLEAAGKYINAKEISDINLGLTHYEPNAAGDKYFLFYYLHYKGKEDKENKGKEEDANEETDIGEMCNSLIVSLCETGGGFKIESIGANNYSTKTSSLGEKRYETLSEMIYTPAITGFGAALARSCCAIVGVLFVIILIQTVSLWVVFDKAGQPGWAAIVPFYNMWVLAEVADKPGWLGLAACFVGSIPYIGPLISLVISIILALGVAKAFERGILFGIGLAFLPFIFYPVLAFGSD